MSLHHLLASQERRVRVSVLVTLLVNLTVTIWLSITLGAEVNVEPLAIIYIVLVLAVPALTTWFLAVGYMRYSKLEIMTHPQSERHWASPYDISEPHRKHIYVLATAATWLVYATVFPCVVSLLLLIVIAIAGIDAYLDIGVSLVCILFPSTIVIALKIASLGRQSSWEGDRE